MRLGDMAREVGATVLTDPARTGAEIDRISAGDVISGLLRDASDSTLIVTNLAAAQVLRVAELMDVPGICLVDGRAPGPALVARADELGTVLMVSPVGMSETCERLNECLSPRPRRVR